MRGPPAPSRRPPAPGPRRAASSGATWRPGPPRRPGPRALPARHSRPCSRLAAPAAVPLGTGTAPLRRWSGPPARLWGRAPCAALRRETRPAAPAGRERRSSGGSVRRRLRRQRPPSPCGPRFAARGSRALRALPLPRTPRAPPPPGREGRTNERRRERKREREVGCLNLGKPTLPSVSLRPPVATDPDSWASRGGRQRFPQPTLV